MDASSNTAAEAPDDCVESMIDRPVGQAIAFLAWSLMFWGRACWRPWRVGREIAAGSPDLPPPFAWLVASLFVAGVCLRLLFAMLAVPATAEASLLDDLRQALGDVSLMDATLLTLPCVAIVALSVRIVSMALGGSGRFDSDRLIAAGCYAIGWQFFLLALVVVVLIAMEMAGMEPGGEMIDEVESMLPYLGVFLFLWGAMLLAPTLGGRLPGLGWVNAAVATTTAVLLTVPLLLVAVWTLGHSIDLKAADRLGSERTQLAWYGELDADLLEAAPLEGFPGRFRLTVAYTSRSKRLLVIPRLESMAALLERSVLMSHEGVGYLPDPDRSPLRVVDSSLDYLPDRALLVEPKATRIAEYTIALDDAAEEAPKPGNAPFAVTYYRRDDDGGFLSGIAPLWAPRDAAALARRSPSLFR